MSIMRGLLAATCGALLGGCQASPEPAVAAAATPETRLLCLAAGAGGNDLAARLATLQRRAERLPQQAERWVDVGRAWVRQARLSADAGHYLHADACASEALAVQPEFTPALELRALVLLNAHRFDEARTVAEAILARDPDNVAALGSLSDALLELGRYHDAAVAAQRQMRVRPGMAALARASYLRWLHGDREAAKVLIRDALVDRDTRDPEPAAWAFSEAAAIFWHEADLGGADALYAQALAWVPEFPAALLGRGRVALARDDLAAALDFALRAQRAQPGVDAAMLLAAVHERRGDAERAAQARAEARELGRRGDALGLARLLADSEPAAALAVLERERRTRGGIYLDDAYAWALHHSGRRAEALLASARALELGTPDARLLYHAGAIRLAAGDAAKGRALLERALALNPAFDPREARAARELLAGAPAVASAGP
jgi:tetratricopeptide (TPR) repeat protein